MIIADGEAISLSKLQELATDKTVMVLDGAYHQIHDTGMRIDYLLGDFDSITPELLKAARDQGTEVIHTPDQDFTDLEKAIQYCQNNDMQEIDIAAATGLRLDHTLYNLRLLKRFHGKCAQLSLVTEIEKIVFLKDESVSLSVKDKQPLALMAFPKAVVTSSGLEYDMDRYLLAFAESESTSNSIVASEAVIDVDGEALLIMSHETDNKRLYV